MGFWDAQLTSLEALGITFSPLFEKVLEEGGQVLRMRHLLVPESNPEYQEDCFDEDNNPVFVIEKIETFGPERLDPHMQVLTGDAMEDDDWKEYPSFLGYLEDEDRYCFGPICECYRGEMLGYYRFWECYPLLDESLYAALATACKRRIQDSIYEDIAEIEKVQWSGDGDFMDVETLWLFHHDLSRLRSQDVESVQEWLSESHRDPESVQSVLMSYEKAVQADYLPSPYHDSERDGNWLGTHFSIRPMEDYLVGNPLALDVWRTLIVQREYAARQIRSIMTPEERKRFNHYEYERD